LSRSLLPLPVLHLLPQIAFVLTMPHMTFSEEEVHSADLQTDKKRKREENAQKKGSKQETKIEGKKTPVKQEAKKVKVVKKEEAAKEVKPVKKVKASEKVSQQEEEFVIKPDKIEAKNTEVKNTEEVKKKEKNNGTDKVQKEKTKAITKPVQVDNAETEAWRVANNVTILGEGCPAPFATFAETKFPPYISSALQLLKFDKPTAIQAQCWPLALGGRDLIGLAETGSGKTLAFLVPAIIHIRNKSAAARAKGPSVLVMAPTRELAQQIEEVAAKTCKVADVKSCCVFGGAAKHDQVKTLKGVDIIIATPGRLIDFLQEGSTHLEAVTYLVLDEADRMLDMGFELQINEVLRYISSKERHTLMFSATWPNDVQRLAQKYFKNPIRITIGNEKLSGAKRVTQIVEVMEEKEKRTRLRKLLTTLFKDNCRILIFMLYKHSCERLYTELLAEGWPVGSIHGNKSQAARNQTLADFKSGAAPIMIATDVAARGLDIKEVKYVINVEFPLKCEDYVHRIGRTGRAGEVGTAYTFFTPDDKVHARELVQIMKESNQTVDEKMLAICEKAPGIKPKKTAMQQLYGDFASSDPTLLNKKPTRIVFDD